MQYLIALLLVVPAFGMFIRDPEWHLWKKTHEKNYVNEQEENYRYTIWTENKHLIEEHNRVKPFVLKMNHFGDMSLVEFSRTMNGYMGKMNFNVSHGSTFLAASNLNEPDTVDWRTKGYVTPVKNQGQCGSCWAFSTTGSLEGQHFKKTGKLVSLSEQNLVDCSRSFGNMGCEGGLMDQAFRYIKENHGLDTESSYPYEGTDDKCQFKKSDVGADDTGYVDIPAGDEAALKKASASIGPISVAIDASHMSFQFYHNHVYDEPSCSSTQLDHGVLVVGYGTEDGKDYWLVKNSWGASWGIDGYIKMSRNKNNQCGIASKASYPLV